MLLKQPLPKQTANVYLLLLRRGPLNAEQIGKELNIFPQAVYRSIDMLKSIGCVTQSGGYPAVFEPLPVDESVETFSLLQREWFLSAFLNTQKQHDAIATIGLNTTFIESREHMYEKLLSDYANVKESLNLIVSGDEIPAENMLAHKKLLERGIPVRTLVQEKSKENETFVQARKRMGEHIRVIEPINARIMLFDQDITYVMSYDPSNYIKSTGIRFEYMPIGQLMHTLFNQYWEKGINL